MKALSVKPCWAWLIVNGWKNIENRSWPTKIRGRVLIHSSKSMTLADYDACEFFMASFTSVVLPPFESLKRGGFVGETVILDCVTKHDSDWFCGPYGFVLDESKPMQFMQCNGRLGFFNFNW